MGSCMRWDCKRDGCFNERCRLQFDRLSALGMTDVDGITEQNGNFLLIEWKQVEKPLATGQRILFERLTAIPQFTVLVVVGDASKMEAKSMMIIRSGRVGAFHRCSIEDVRRYIHYWARLANSRKDSTAGVMAHAA